MVKKVPEIRFKGFFDDWEQRKFFSIVNRISKTSHSNKLPKVEFEDIISGEGRLNKDISSKFDERKGILFEPGNILYGKLRPYLKNWLYPDFKGIALGDFWVFETEEPVSEFVYYLIQTGSYQKVANDTSGTKMPRSDWKKVSNTNFSIPLNIEEQKKISIFFKQIDNTITLHLRKLDALQQLKKGFLQQIFLRDGEKVPQLRFVHFQEEWEQRKLGDLAESFEYGLNASAKEYDGKNKYLRITDIDEITHQFNQDGLTSPDIDVKNSSDFLLNEQDILFARTGASVGKTYRYKTQDGKVYFAGFLIRARIQECYNTEFIFQNTLTEKYNNFIKITSQRSGQPGVNAKEYSSFQISMPKNEEQQFIGAFFQKIDSTIALHQSKLENLQSIKHSLLQKMFL